MCGSIAAIRPKSIIVPPKAIPTKPPVPPTIAPAESATAPPASEMPATAVEDAVEYEVEAGERGPKAKNVRKI